MEIDRSALARDDEHLQLVRTVQVDRRALSLFPQQLLQLVVFISSMLSSSDSASSRYAILKDESTLSDGDCCYVNRRVKERNPR